MDNTDKVSITTFLGVFEEKLRKERKRLKKFVQLQLQDADSQCDIERVSRARDEIKKLEDTVHKLRKQTEPETPTRSDLFVKQDWVMHSGGTAHYKIDCDALTDNDVKTIAFIISQKGKFSEVYGVPRGGTRLQHALEKYRTPGGIRLIVDDVLTTGRSMEEARQTKDWPDAVGVVIFARNMCPDWIKPIFQMNWINVPDDF